MRAAFVAVGLSIVAIAARDASACSCMDIEGILLSPTRDAPAPLNTHVLVDVVDAGVPGFDVVLRAHGGAEVPSTAKRATTATPTVELVPKAPLAPGTTYEVGVRDPRSHPPLYVFGAFTTGDAVDTKAPSLVKLGRAVVQRNAPLAATLCAYVGTWLVVDDIAAADAGRQGRLSLWVWGGDKSGVVDDRKAPMTIEIIAGPRLEIGRGSVCDRHRGVPLPDHGVASLGVAVVDEAGNRSPTRRFTVDFGKAPSP